MKSTRSSFFHIFLFESQPTLTGAQLHVLHFITHTEAAHVLRVRPHSGKLGIFSEGSNFK